MRKILVLFLALSVFGTLLSGCQKRNEPTKDLSGYDFVDVEWTRDSDVCFETLHFNSDGSFGYHCACGEPVNYADLCEGYSYNPETQTIYLDFSERIPEAVSEIKLKSCDGKSLVLDFGGDIRAFKNAQEEPMDLSFGITYNGKKYTLLQFSADIFYYDLCESVDYEEDTVLPLQHSNWDLIYYNGDILILDSQAEDAAAFYGNDENFKWSVFIDDPQIEETYTLPLSLSKEELKYIYSMESAQKESTLFFEDIEISASLIKTSNDGLISASTSLAFSKNTWYWRSEVINETIEGWPEYVVNLPESLSKQLNELYSSLPAEK